MNRLELLIDAGAMNGYKGDVVALGLTWQVKALASGYRTLYAALDGHDALSLRQGSAR
jgi:hypothetical protein